MSKDVSCAYDGTLRLGGQCKFCEAEFLLAIGPKAQEVVMRNACDSCIDKFTDKHGHNVDISRHEFAVVRCCANLVCRKLFKVADIPKDGAFA